MVWITRCLTLLLWTLFTLSINAYAADSPSPSGFSNRVILTDTQGEYRLGRHLLILEDPTNELTLEEIRSKVLPNSFTVSTHDAPGFGFNPSAYWARVEIDRQTTQESTWILKFGYAPMQWIDVYAIYQDGHVLHQKGGMVVDIKDRPKPQYYQHLFEVPLPANQKTTLYIRIAGETSKNIILDLYKADAFTQALSRELTALAIYAGIVIALACYNIVIFYSIRDYSYLYYVIFLLTFSTATMSVFGVLQWLIENNATLRIKIVPSGIGLGSLFAWIFTISFLGSKKAAPKIHTFFLFLVGWSLLAIIMPWFSSYRFAIIFSGMLTLTSSLIAIFFALFLAYRGVKTARIYLLAWFFLLLGVFLSAARLFGLLPNNTLTEYGQIWGSAAEAILLSVALAIRMRLLKEEKEFAQAAQVVAQEESLKNKQALLETVQQYSTKLEAEVKARTEQLLETQQKLIATEKMAALGVFTAGMAHEINNPANFVSVGAQNAEFEVNKLQTFIGYLLNEDTDTDIKRAFDERFTHINGALDVIKTGVKRIEQVVSHLRATHPEDETGFQPVDVVSTLESSWPILQATLKVPITLTTDFRDRPSTPCVIAEIQQVLLALLNNAVHAIEDAMAVKGPDYRGQIQLTSHVENGKLMIHVTDNGVGMSPDILDKMFDPFFTTKTVGRGAGLGLSMARDVVNKHQGSLEAVSKPGEGAMLTLRLPLSRDVAGA